MSSTTENRDSRRVDGDGSGALNALFDALVTLLIAVPGISAAAAGVAVYRTAGPATSEAIVEDMEVTSTVVSEPVLVDAIYGLMVWGGVGLAITGLLVTAVGVGFFLYSRRLRRRRERSDVVLPDRNVLVVVGAVVSAVTSFVPFSPLIGGGLAGYVQRSDRGDGVRIGALAGLALAAPYAIVLAFLVGGALSADAAPIALLLTGALVVSTVVTVVLSALGGYAGSILADREE